MPHADLRNRDRDLISKDATIREIHHRVKNNLQTVAALLRIQARRMTVPEARSALEEATRRVGSIALVHETLSHSLEETVDFDEVATGLSQALADVFSSDGSVQVRQVGSFGTLPAEPATALAMASRHQSKPMWRQDIVNNGCRGLGSVQARTKRKLSGPSTSRSPRRLVSPFRPRARADEVIE